MPASKFSRFSTLLEMCKTLKAAHATREGEELAKETRISASMSGLLEAADEQIRCKKVALRGANAQSEFGEMYNSYLMRLLKREDEIVSKLKKNDVIACVETIEQRARSKKISELSEAPYKELLAITQEIVELAASHKSLASLSEKMLLSQSELTPLIELVEAQMWAIFSRKLNIERFKERLISERTFFLRLWSFAVCCASLIAFSSVVHAVGHFSGRDSRLVLGIGLPIALLLAVACAISANFALALFKEKDWARDMKLLNNVDGQSYQDLFGRIELVKEICEQQVELASETERVLPNFFSESDEDPSGGFYDALQEFHSAEDREQGYEFENAETMIKSLLPTFDRPSVPPQLSTLLEAICISDSYALLEQRLEKDESWKEYMLRGTR